MPSSVVFEIISIVSFALSGLLFIIASVLFVKFKIPAVVGYLTGNTAKKKIQEMQQNSFTENGDESYNRTDNSDIDKHNKPYSKKDERKQKKENKNQVELSQNSNETVVLKDDCQTEVLDSENHTTVLNSDNTAVLYEDTYQSESDKALTQVLNSEEAQDNETEELKCSNKVSCQVETDIKFTHSNEIIK